MDLTIEILNIAVKTCSGLHHLHTKPGAFDVTNNTSAILFLAILLCTTLAEGEDRMLSISIKSHRKHNYS